MNILDKIIMKLFRSTISKVVKYTVKENDLEWFQIIESILNFHPASKIDALKTGIAKIKILKNGN
jgi:hypothetical protein